jgi:hypothetical protein
VQLGKEHERPLGQLSPKTGEALQHALVHHAGVPNIESDKADMFPNNRVQLMCIFDLQDGKILELTTEDPSEATSR